ncbi:MAG: hypothetical protein ACRDTF_06815 [Pseudonocardiaceae bacterium]
MSRLPTRSVWAPAAVKVIHRTPVIVQALITSLLAYGYALVGAAERLRCGEGSVP